MEELHLFFFSRVHSTLKAALSVGPSVGPSVRPSVAVHEARDLWRSALFWLSLGVLVKTSNLSLNHA